MQTKKTFFFLKMGTANPNYNLPTQHHTLTPPGDLSLVLEGVTPWAPGRRRCPWTPGSFPCSRLWVEGFCPSQAATAWHGALALGGLTVHLTPRPCCLAPSDAPCATTTTASRPSPTRARPPTPPLPVSWTPERPSWPPLPHIT